MSQAKVDAYKERKKNRKKIEAHEKRMAWVRGLIALLVLALIVAWAGYSAYVKHMDNQPHKTTEVDYTAINDYSSDMSSQESEETDEAETEDEAGEAETSEDGAAEGEAAEGEAEQTDENSGE